MAFIDTAAQYLQEFSDYLQQLKIMEIRIMLEFFGDQYQNLVYAMVVFIIMEIAKFSVVLVLTFLSVILVYVAIANAFSESARNSVINNLSSSYFTPDGHSVDEPFFPQIKQEEESEIEKEPENMQQKYDDSDGSKESRMPQLEEEIEPKTETTQEPENENKRQSFRQTTYLDAPTESSSGSEHSKVDKEVQTDRSRLSKNPRVSKYSK